MEKRKSNNPRLEIFEFTFEPVYYAHKDGDEKQLRVRVVVNGQTFNIQNIFRIEDVKPWESEIDFYMRKITEQLKYEIKNHYKT